MNFEGRRFENSHEVEEINFFELLAGIEDINENHISEFKEKIIPKYQELFEDNVTESDKYILTFLSNISDTELAALLKMQKDGGRLVGFHDVGEHIQTLTLLTGDERYPNVFHSVRGL